MNVQADVYVGAVKGSTFTFWSVQLKQAAETQVKTGSRFWIACHFDGGAWTHASN
jgi:hypothetical protein